MLSDPVLYHLHHLQATEDVNFWSNLADQYGGPILELGCGTGRLLSPLTERGHQVIGLDLNFPALAYLRNSVDGELLDRIRIFQSGMDNFHLNESFSMIFLACNTLSTLSMETRKVAYKRIGDHLGPGGVFAASIPNPAYLIEIPAQGAAEKHQQADHQQRITDYQPVERIHPFPEAGIEGRHFSQLSLSVSLRRLPAQSLP
jgi:SAM-dependent methyltransferase